MSNKLGIQIDSIIKLHRDGKNIGEISEQLGCSPSNISKRLKRKGISIVRDYSKSRRNRDGRYKIDTSFFKRIDSEKKAYFLGIMMSDGGVSDTQFYLKLKDEDVVVKFKEALRCENPIRHNTEPYYNYILQISCREIITDLIKLGCTPNKTKTLKFPDIPESLYNHFIRGFMDGDGCIRVGENRSTDYFDITSASYTFIVQLKNVLLPYTSHIGISKERLYDVWHVRCGGKQVKSLLDWIYKDATVYMDRKYFKYKLLSSR